jgi:hypothetical protein
VNRGCNSLFFFFSSSLLHPSRIAIYTISSLWYEIEGNIEPRRNSLIASSALLLVYYHFFVSCGDIRCPYCLLFYFLSFFFFSSLSFYVSCFTRHFHFICVRYFKDRLAQTISGRGPCTVQFGQACDCFCGFSLNISTTSFD